ncbi:hypothetical protein RHSIM_Rhsim01G0195900 [Rhododendron simsii]|uniref:Protein kinase domain-containing protein n=1 Tax=Rhododendron simsii TaxID=118357 RepID=A0A834HQL2_RHOSS|nr:hypothetical protein RHSIM_Rhsim01G0195900 [Rhododendron simsii]
MYINLDIGSLETPFSPNGEAEKHGNKRQKKNKSSDDLDKQLLEALHTLQSSDGPTLEEYNRILDEMQLFDMSDPLCELDGYLISAVVPRDQQIPYRGRGSGECYQNVLAIYDIDMFTFVWAGWEGIAHDSRVLRETISDPANNFPILPLAQTIYHNTVLVIMAIAAPGQLNIIDSPSWGSRSVDCFEKLEQIGEGTYGVSLAAFSCTVCTINIKYGLVNSSHNHEELFPPPPFTCDPPPVDMSSVHLATDPLPDGNKYKGGIYMVFEYMDHDLTGLADRPGMRFSVAQIKCYMRQLLTGLHYCHVNQVLHRDIKGSNLLIDNEGNLKLADFGLARSFSNDHNGNLTNRVITLWYRPPELLLGTTKYGPAVDMWSVGCIFAELLHGKPIFPGKDEPEQLNKIFDICGAPEESNWPGVSKIPWYNNFKPTRQLKRRLREVYKHFDRHALELLDRMLTLDPSQTGQGHAQMRPGPNQQPMHSSQPPVAAGPSHHYAKPRPSGGPSRYPQGGNPVASGGYSHANRSQGGGGGGGYGGSGAYPPQGRGAPPYGSSGGPSGGPRGGVGGYGVGAPNYPQGGGQYGSSGTGRGNRNQQYGWQQ